MRRADGGRASPATTTARLLEREGDIAADYLEVLLDIADLDGDIDIDVEGDRAAVSVVGPGLERLIGPGGATLDALQELTRLAVHRETGVRSRLMLDVGGHRARRRAELSKLGAEAAQRVARDRRGRAAGADDAVRAQDRPRRGRRGRRASRPSPRARSPSAGRHPAGVSAASPPTARARAGPISTRRSRSRSGRMRGAAARYAELLRTVGDRARPDRAARGRPDLGAPPAQLRRGGAADSGGRSRRRSRLRRRPARDPAGDRAARPRDRAARADAAPGDFLAECLAALTVAARHRPPGPCRGRYRARRRRRRGAGSCAAGPARETFLRRCWSQAGRCWRSRGEAAAGELEARCGTAMAVEADCELPAPGQPATVVRAMRPSRRGRPAVGAAEAVAMSSEPDRPPPGDPSTSRCAPLHRHRSSDTEPLPSRRRIAGRRGGPTDRAAHTRRPRPVSRCRSRPTGSEPTRCPAPVAATSDRADVSRETLAWAPPARRSSAGDRPAANRRARCFT